MTPAQTPFVGFMSSLLETSWNIESEYLNKIIYKGRNAFCCVSLKMFPFPQSDPTFNHPFKKICECVSACKICARE